MKSASQCLAVLMLTALVAVAQACDPCPNDNNNNNNGAGGSSADSPYWRAYQQWLQWQQRVYEDRRRDAEARAEQLKRDRLDRQLYHPPVTQIWAAEPLNGLLANLQTLQAQGATLPEVEIDAKTLARINLTGGGGAGKAGMLKQEGALVWPLVLRRREFQAMTGELSDIVKHLVAATKAGTLDGDDYQHAKTALNRALDQVRSRVNLMSASEYGEAKRYLTDLGEAFQVLKQPDAASYFNADYAARGHNVKELLAHMTKNGLRFGAAAPQDKAAYLVLHRALASCALAARESTLFQ